MYRVIVGTRQKRPKLEKRIAFGVDLRNVGYIVTTISTSVNTD